ncbi:MAG: serine/threonine-protein kinase [Planctomycetota bacterium]
MSNLHSPISLSSTDSILPTDVEPGLARYTRLSPMARGGVAQLRSAYDPVTGRTVAIKSLLPDTPDSRRERKRLLREARITAQLEHPNTVPVYDIGMDEVDGPFFVMKRISGENLFEILKRIAMGDEQTARDFPVVKRLEILADACQALIYSHVRGVIHRDVKPENIWVGNFGEVILLDWGAAKVWGDNFEEGAARSSSLVDPRDLPQTLTLADQRIGTPLYMSPEQITGRGSLDERSDIFSVGTCIYDVAAMREPFRGRDVQETFDNIVNRRPEMLSGNARVVDSWSEEIKQLQSVPPQVDTIFEKATEKSPGDRYGSMRELVQAIRSAIG